MKDEIKEMAEVIENKETLVIVNDKIAKIKFNFGEAIKFAEALHNAGYRKRSKTVKEFAGEATKAINYEWDNYNTKDKPDTYWRGKRNGLFTAINTINELAEQYGKED